MPTDINKKSKAKYFRYILSFILALTIAFTVPFAINAAIVQPDDPPGSNYRSFLGYAVYRDGATFDISLEDHAAIMVEENNTYTLPIVHAVGSTGFIQFGPVQRDSWSNFLGGNTNSFWGYYKPKNCIMTSALADNFAELAMDLTGKPYTFVSQILHNAELNSRVEIDNITHLRCDGVVEYVYEWFGYRVGGSNIGWDITQSNPINFAEHSGILITPRKQRTELLDFISVS